MRAIYPVSCPHCKGRLTCRAWLPLQTRWCRRCQCTVQYFSEEELLHFATVDSKRVVKGER